MKNLSDIKSIKDINEKQSILIEDKKAFVLEVQINYILILEKNKNHKGFLVNIYEFDLKEKTFKKKKDAFKRIDVNNEKYSAYKTIFDLF